MRRRSKVALFLSCLLGALVAVVAMTGVVHAGADWRGGELGPALALSAEVDDSLRAGLLGEDLSVMGIGPGSDFFQGEWAFATWMMAAVGHGQIGLQHPEHRDELAARTSRAVDALLEPEPWRFDRQQWGDLALSHLGDDRHDHAVLGYLGVAMGLERRLDPDNRHAETHDAVVAALSRRLRTGPILETYPGVAFPVDHAMAVATVALHAQALGQPPPPWLQAHLRDYRERFVDERGLLVQAVHPGSGKPRSVGRGSGTALAAWALAWADPQLSRDLSVAVRDELGDRVAGLVVVREYPPAICAAGHPCQGDVDSGPLVMGASVSATGFSLAAARRLQDDRWFDGLWGTTRVFGRWTGQRFAAGGPLGNAIMLAMLTVPPLDGPDVTPSTRSAR